MSKPVIGVTCAKYSDGIRVNRNIQRIVEEMGGEVRPLNWETLKLYELLGEVLQIDGYIFPGGGDLLPSFYGQEKLPECGAPCVPRDDLEMNLFPLLMQRNLPILGICRGCQMINAGFGGTLVQDLPSQRGVVHRQPSEEGYFHTVTIAGGTRLLAAVGQAEIQVNSLHHQAVDELAEGFRVSALAPDGTVEGIECIDRSRFIVGVQWHPEMLDDEYSKSIFAAFMGAVALKKDDCH